MAVPYRLFTRLHKLQCRGSNASNNFVTAADWADVHLESSRLLWRKNATDWDRWYVLYKGYTEDGWGQAGADKVMDVDSIVEYCKPYLEPPGWNYFYDESGPYRDNAWDTAKGTGRYYDGVNEYPVYPHRWYSYDSGNQANHTVNNGDIPSTRHVIHEPYNFLAHNAQSLTQSTEILTNGLKLGMAAFDPSQAGWSAGQGMGIDVNIKSVELRYFNACVNSLSRYTGPAAGGWPLIMTGLGLANSDAEINSKTGAPWSVAWGDTVYKVYLEKPDGTVVATLQAAPLPAPSFVVDSNTQLTVASMPALAPGLYQIRIHKTTGGVDIYSYAGDWRTDPDGRMTTGRRLYLWIYDTYTPPRTPIITTTWRWKKGDLTVFKYYAPVDVRSRLTFWEGMILGISPFTRGISGESHLPLFPDMQITLDNTSREFSKLLSEYWCKNQLVEVFFGWQEEPAAFHSQVFRGIVSDYERPGSQWTVRLRDVLEKYFAVKIPRYRCTVEEYPNIAEDHVGRVMPEVLGLASLTTGDKPGAVEAIYVDTATYKYLAARGSLHAVLEVYSDGVLKTETTDYAISYEDGGRTYITFTADQGTAKVTFNAEGYTYPDWDSANEYVQNPAYIVLFLLAFFAEIPDINVDIPAFDDEAAIFELLGFGEAGCLIMQDTKAASDYLQELMFTYGLYHWIKGDGKITVGRKDISDISASVHLFQQIDALDEAKKPVGFDEAVNAAVVSWGYFPTANQYSGVKKVTRDSSITAFEAEIHPASDWNFPWTTSEALVDLRAQENLLRLGFGNQSINIPLSTKLLSSLDVFTNFKFQDPWGISRTGAGDVGKLFFAESLGIDLLGGKVELKGADLQWLLRQYCVLGDRSVLPATWASATEDDRLYWYLCDRSTGLLPDGEPGKALIDRNLGG